MMHRRFLTTGMLLASALMPLTAHAYLTPDDVLNESDYSATYDAPPSKRRINDVIEEQQRRSAQRRDAEQAALRAKDDEETHNAAPQQPSDASADETELDKLLKLIELLQTDDATHSAAPQGQSSEEERLLARIRARQNTDEVDVLLPLPTDETLHSGAPLADTGPATVLIVLAVAAAIGETWRRVKRAEAK